MTGEQACAHERKWQHFTVDGEVWCSHCHIVLWAGIDADHNAVRELREALEAALDGEADPIDAIRRALAALAHSQGAA